MSSSLPPTDSSGHIAAGTINYNDQQPGQPLFERNAMSPRPGGQQQHNHDPIAGHPHVEQMLNATAKHVFPEKPAPNEKETGGSKDVSKEGLPHVAHRGHAESGSRSHHSSSRRQSKAADTDDEDDEDDEDKDPDQKPLMHGTPLDELKTPMFERSRGVLDMKPAASPAVIGSGMSKLGIHDEDEETPFASPTGSSMPDVPGPRPPAAMQEDPADVQPERPPIRGMGSVSFRFSFSVPE